MSNRRSQASPLPESDGLRGHDISRRIQTEAALREAESGTSTDTGTSSGSS